MRRYTHFVQTARDVWRPQITMRDKAKRKENKKHTSITSTFFCIEAEQERRPKFSRQIFFKTMGFNSHIRLFCRHRRGVGKWSENMAEGTKHGSLLFFASAHLEAIVCVFLVLVD